MKRKFFTLFLCTFIIIVQAVAQQKKITGHVTDENAAPLTGVTVLVKGTNTATTTGTDGSYSILVNQGQTLVFSFVATISEEKVVGNESVINVSLKPNATALNQVVIVGYGCRKNIRLATCNRSGPWPPRVITRPFDYYFQWKSRAVS